MKKIVFSCLVIILIVYSFIYPKEIVSAVYSGIKLWFNQILPALFPFTVLSIMLIKSNFLTSFKGNASLLATLITLTCGFIFGFPIGAKLSADFYSEGLLSEKNATILSIATNNFSPMFVCGFAIPLLFKSNTYRMITYFLLYLTPLILISLFLICTSNGSNEVKSKIHNNFNINMKIMDKSIVNGFETLIKLCGYIVIFSIITQILSSIKLPVIILQNIEITNGIQMLSKCDLTSDYKYILAIQALSLGGLSGFAQTGSILSDSGLSMHKYIIGKVALSLLITLLSVIYVFFIR